MQKAWYPGQRQGRGRKTRHRHSRGAREPVDRLPGEAWTRRARAGATWRRIPGTAPSPPRPGRGRRAPALGIEKPRPIPVSPPTPHAVILGAQVLVFGCRCEPGVAGLGLSRMNSLQTAGCRRQKGLPPGDVGGDGAGPQGTKPGVAVGWMEAAVRLARRGALRCPNAPGSAALAQPSPAIGSETRNGTDRAGWAPRTVCSQPRLQPWVTCPRLACSPAHLHARPWPCPWLGRAAPACRPWLFFNQTGRTSFDSYGDCFPIAEGTSEAPCPASLHFRCGRCGKQLAPGAPAPV